jgi:Mn2+/Fe2+ NRAMP family transporter
MSRYAFILILLVLGVMVRLAMAAYAAKAKAAQPAKTAKPARHSGKQTNPAFTAQAADALGLALAAQTSAPVEPDWRETFGQDADWA